MVKVSTKLWEGAYFSPSSASTLVLKSYRQADHNVANPNCIVSWLSNCLWLVNWITCEPVNRRQLSSLQQSVVAQTLVNSHVWKQCKALSTKRRYSSPTVKITANLVDTFNIWAHKCPSSFSFKCGVKAAAADWSLPLFLIKCIVIISQFFVPIIKVSKPFICNPIINRSSSSD